MDVDGIALGRDFRTVIEETLGQCGVMLAVIGKTWLQNTDAKGNRRIDQPGDFVRLEIGTALKRNIPVIPVCVQGAGVPTPDDLPDSSGTLSGAHFFSDRSDPLFSVADSEWTGTSRPDAEGGNSSTDERDRPRAVRLC